MPPIMPQSELVRKAAKFIAEMRSLHPEQKLSHLLDEAGMRFNLNPLESASLERFFTEEATQSE